MHQNDGNGQNKGNIQYHPYFINQPIQNPIPNPPNRVQSQTTQRSKKDSRKRATIGSIQSSPTTQPTTPNQFYTPQTHELNSSTDYSLSLIKISDDKLDLFCQLFDIPVQQNRQFIINYFRSNTIPKLYNCNPKLLSDFFEFINNPKDLIMRLREPPVPRIFQRIRGVNPRYILIQFFQNVQFELQHLIIPPFGSICIGQFISCSLNSIPYGTVKINDREIPSVNFGEIGQFYLLGSHESINHSLFRLFCNISDHSFVWFVIQYLSPNHSFSFDFCKERCQNSDAENSCLVRSTICNCPPFALQASVESAYLTGFVCCPTCSKQLKFDQLIVVNSSIENNQIGQNQTSNAIPNFQAILGQTMQGFGMIPMPTIAAQLPLQKKGRAKKGGTKAKLQMPLQVGIPMNGMMPMGIMNMNLRQPVGLTQKLAANKQLVASPQTSGQMAQKPAIGAMMQQQNQNASQNQKQPKQKKVKNAQSNQITPGENDTQKSAGKSAKQRQKSTKIQAQTQTSTNEENQQTSINENQDASPALENEQTDQIEPENDEVESPEMKAARLRMNSFLCANSKMWKGGLDWKKCIYENENDLKIHNEDFNNGTFQDADEYLDFVDSLM